MRFLGRKWQKKNTGNSNGNRISQLALGDFAALGALRTPVSRNLRDRTETPRLKPWLPALASFSGKKNCHCKGKNKMRGFFAALRMTRKRRRNGKDNDGSGWGTVRVEKRISPLRCSR